MGFPLDENAYMQGLYTLRFVSPATDAESKQLQAAGQAQLLVAAQLDRIFAGDEWVRVTHEGTNTRVAILKHGYRLAFASERPNAVAITGLRLNGWRRGRPISIYKGPLYEEDLGQAVRLALVDWYRQVGGVVL